MSNAYALVHWNRAKKVYDLFVALGVLVLVGAFFAGSRVAHRGPEALSVEITLLRALAATALVLLHVILCIGPVARLTPLAAPLLYNRRHLGVTMFLVALAHAVLATLYDGAFAGRNPILAVLAGYGDATLAGFPFEMLGLFALLILFVMAATSHDFWLANLTPRVWKALHMMVYAAYALIVLHAALGFLQSERSPLYPGLLGAGVVVVGSLHIAAARRERRADRVSVSPGAAVSFTGDWIDAADFDEISESRAKVICVKGHGKVALFKHQGAVSAVANVCAHQGGPLGEGRVVSGCITCPWHGYQYLPHNGQSPPPFTEKIATYEVRVRGRRVLLNPRPLPPGTPTTPARPDAHGTPRDGATVPNSP